MKGKLYKYNMRWTAARMDRPLRLTCNRKRGREDTSELHIISVFV